VKLELTGITKRFGSLVANDDIDLTVEPGEIRALLGENGAGKTTLMNVLIGLVQPDAGEIRVDGKPVVIHSPKDAIAARIGMVHQHFMLVPVFTVAENVTLGLEPTRALGLLDRRRARSDVRKLSERYGLQVDPDAYVEDLPVGVQQRVEIIKTLMREASVLILDEPTSVLTPGETDDLFRIMRELRAGGRSIVFISHKLREVQAIADTITIIRRGTARSRLSPVTSFLTPRTLRSPASTGLPWWTTFRSRSGRERSWAWPASRATGRPSSARRCSACGRHRDQSC
jgi:simple sugar transport system ATP-binding protein